MAAHRILLSGPFGDSDYCFPSFERITQALQRDGAEVARFNSFGYAARGGWRKTAERLVTLPGRLVGVDKRRLKYALPWTPEARRERGLIDAVRRFQPRTLIVVRGHPHQASTLDECRWLGVRELVGWYVEGPLERGLAEAESQLYDRYYCIHTEIDADAQARIGWLPSYALDTANFKRHRFPRRCEQRVVFVGTATPRRIRFLRALVHLPLQLWGPGWAEVPELAPFHRGEFIWGAALNDLYNDSAIVLNLASWSGELSGMTQRIVEIPASGAFMLTDAATEATRLFEAGAEMDVFHSPLDLRMACEYYLANDGAREQFAHRGHRRALGIPGFDATAKVLAGSAAAPTCADARIHVTRRAPDAPSIQRRALTAW